MTSELQWYAAQPKEWVPSCNLCGGHSFARKRREDRYGLPVSQTVCLRCGLKFLNPRMTASAYMDFYRDGHYRRLLSDFYDKPITAASIEEEQMEYAQHLIGLLDPHLEGLVYDTLLDVGGSTGVVAEAVAMRYGLDATVLEPSLEEAQRAADKGLRVLHGTVENMDPGEEFDLILLCQTVDHLLDIKKSLRMLRQMLSAPGLFFVDVVIGGPLKIDHPYDLSEDALLLYLAGAGFQVLTSGPSGDGLHHYFVCGGSCWQPH